MSLAKKLLIALVGIIVVVFAGGYIALNMLVGGPGFEAQPAGTVTTPRGAIQGVTTEDDGITNFKGIPFAEAPVGDLRWRAPVAKAAWSETLIADSFGPRCTQSKDKRPDSFARRLVRGLGLGYFKTELALSLIEASEAAPVSEDCLYLNVRTPAAGDASAKLPVMFWIHGGSHTGGSGSDDLYQSNALVKEGVVLVTINYRLGAFGYMAHPALSAENENGVSGNYGFLDQMQALKWVQENIEAFGGDRDNVTIFGESAGAWAVSELVASPLSRGLFHKAIGESGASSTLHFLRGTPVSNKSGEGEGAKIASGLGLNGATATVDELRAVPAEDIMTFVDATPGITGIFHPIVDGWAIPKPVAAIYEDGEQANVPFLLGGNADEGSLFYYYYQGPNTWGGPAPRDQVEFETWMTDLYGDLAPRLIELYGMQDEATRREAEIDMLGDDTFLVHVRRTAALHAQAQPNTYLYHFTRTPPDEGQTVGAFHAAELFFLFDKFNPAIYEEAEDENLQQHIVKYWTNFAKTGNPNGEGLTEWPTYSRVNDKWMVLDREIAYGPVGRAEKLNLLERRMDQAVIRARDTAILSR